MSPRSAAEGRAMQALRRRHRAEYASPVAELRRHQIPIYVVLQERRLQVSRHQVAQRGGDGPEPRESRRQVFRLERPRWVLGAQSPSIAALAQRDRPAGAA